MALLQANDYIGNYKILNKIGEGGMALIYKALQPALKRPVVLKKLKDPNREIIRRFKKEALLSASFHHENLVAIYDFLYANRSYFLVMEYVNGEDLRTIIDHMAPLPAHMAAMIILGIARGLEYTHTRNIIHRDIKPSNILISYQGDVKLIDFGIAKDDVSTRLTQTGMIVGTPSYMAPEQANGEAITEQSDLFPLGILLYESLTGLKPFYAENNTEVLTKIVRAKYIPPEQINPSIPRPLRKIVKKALRKDPKKRYRNATEMIHDLELFIPWQLRSKKKDILSRYLKKLDKTSPSTDESLKLAIYAAIPAWSWRLVRSVLTLLFLFLLTFTGIRFGARQLGYAKLEGARPGLTLAIDGKKAQEIRSTHKKIGPLLRGWHKFIFKDQISGQTLISVLPVSPADTVPLPIPPRQRLQAAQLLFSSRPAGAKLSIDGHPLGVTPLSQIELIPGKHRIRISKEGYQTLEDQMNTSASGSYRIQYVLSPVKR